MFDNISTETLIEMHCGACGDPIVVTEYEWQTLSIAPCVCGEGADLLHARAHCGEFVSHV